MEGKEGRARLAKVKVKSREADQWLIEGTLRTIPFDALLSFLLMMDFIYNKVPFDLVGPWFFLVFFISGLRWYYSYWIFKQIKHQKKFIYSRSLFLTLTCLMGLVWGSCYFLFLPHLPRLEEIVIILLLGGMAVGSMTALSAWPAAYHAYLLPMFIPVIFYNYLQMTTQRTILATIFSLFVVMLLIMAKLNSALLESLFSLSREKDVLISSFKQANKKLGDYVDKLKVVSTTDPLTGLNNRRCFDKVLKRELNRAVRNGYPLVLIFIDIDNFKTLNDRFGHPYGDKFLVKFAKVLNQSIQRSNDSVFRLGGDEFAAIMANISIHEADELCNRITEKYYEKIKHEDVSLSIGVVCKPVNVSMDQNALILAADQALYDAKNAGKNKLVSKILYEDDRHPS